jgi:hypothetical protein
MVELKLPLGFSVEADALYRPLQLTVSTQGIRLGVNVHSTDVHTLEVPILAKYHFLHAPLINPYIEAGPMFRAVGETDAHLSKAGFAMGVGVDLKLVLLRIEPEIRYSRWGSDGTFGSFPPLPSNLNQAVFLIGLSF